MTMMPSSSDEASTIPSALAESSVAGNLRELNTNQCSDNRNSWARNSTNGNAIESIFELHYNYANYVNYANYLIGKNAS